MCFALVLFPIWWALGLAYLIWPLLTFPLLLSLIVRRKFIIPRSFGLWLLFMAWLLLSAFKLGAGGHTAFLWRASIYSSAAVIFLYVVNLRDGAKAERRVLGALTIFWAEVVVGGFLGVLFPHFSFSTPTEAVTPKPLLQEQFIRYMVHPGLAEVMTFLGYPVGRPKTLFAYSNHWGGCIAVLTPIALASLWRARQRKTRGILLCLLAASAVPIAVSLNRGMWLGLIAGLAYMALRLARWGQLRALGGGVVAVLAVAGMIAVSPLGAVVHDRLTQHSESNDTRLAVYRATIEEVRESPIFGWGSPRANQNDPNLPPMGTQSQFFLVLYSQGVPGALFFVSFFLWALRRSTYRMNTSDRLCLHVALVIFSIEMLYYDFMPTTLHLTMVIAALAWRASMRERPRQKEQECF